MNIVPVIQRSEEWHLARAGSLGASQLLEVIAKTKSGYSTSRQNLLGEMAAERLTGKPTDRYSNTAMQWGNDNEDDARRLYAFEHDVAVEEVGMILHPTIPGTHASPDGIIVTPDNLLIDGLVEIKCPFVTAQHLATLVGREIKAEYMAQMHWQMACSGAAWVDYVSFDPRLPAELQLFVRRIPRDDDVIEVLETEVRSFLSDLDDLLGELKRRFGVEVRP